MNTQWGRVLGTAFAVMMAASVNACTSTVENEEKVDPAPLEEDKEETDASPPKQELSSTTTCSASDWSFTLPTCGACAESSCCDALDACGKDCQGYRDCASECTTTACVSTCRTTWAAGTKAYDKVLACLEGSCKAECIPKKGIGDACEKDSECESGVCSGWCTKPCSRGSDCNNPRTVTNENGSYNYCVETSSGAHYCFPGCNGTAFCNEHYSNAASCIEVSTPGGAVPICSY